MKKTILMLIMLFSLVASAMASSLSVTNPQYIKFQNDILKPAWQVTTQGDGSSDYVVFGNGEEITGTVDGVPAHAKEDFTLKSSIVEETCNYALGYDTGSRTIISSRMDHIPNVLITDVNKKFQECIAKGSDLWYSLPQGLITRQVYCWYEDKEANVGLINSPKLNFRAKFELSKGTDTPIVKEVTSLGASQSSDLPSSVFFEQGGNKVALVKWTGFGTFSGDFCPSFSGDYASIESIGTSGNRWYLIKKAPLTEYVISARAYEDKFDDVFSTVYNGDTISVTQAQHDSLVKAADRLNRDADLAMDETVVQYNSINSIVNNKAFSIDLQRKLLYAPVFNMFIWADYLQVVYESGYPQISGIRFNDCSESAAGGSNYVAVDVYNKGEGTSEVISSISCSGNIKLDITSSKITLKPGDAGTLKFPFTVGLGSDSTQSCSVTVYDAVYPSNKDSKSTSTLCRASVVCTSTDPIKCAGTTTYACENNAWIAKKDRFDCAKEICGDGIDNDGDKLVDEGCGNISTECTGITCTQDNQCIYPETKKCCPSECGDPCNYNGEPEPLLGETLENCRPDFLTCNYDNVCDANEGKPGQDATVCADCDQAPDYNWLWIAGGIVAAVIVAILLFKYLPQKGKKKR